ncbi:NAD(P)-binding domain-containing protein [Aminobacter anthyllidis]|uniref:NAD(P)-binding domain-containing protein n=1 Tax=Aminobacter anthyllidis TaxID=1035067 RepID=A0A9X1D8Y9_9HYPH|nr:NAD(P)/FAD-dependent oxidoreductase [Aminobacter anthyllidis]MBT1159664.1 NAD(P)-binding domain-containing protein [Aminobacter anthyllidis]
MSVEEIDTLVVGGGQAGIAMSEHLSKGGVPHLVLERGRVAERWRSERWDSLVTNGPAWHDRFPGMEFESESSDAFVSKEKVADYFAAYAEMIAAPLRLGVEVLEVQKIGGRLGFLVRTSAGLFQASNVIAATGAFQRPVIPALVPDNSGHMQIHSSGYRNPDQLPSGAVLVVGAGSSGTQIADELARAGRQVYLSVGPHDRPPRAYRQRDCCWWLGVLGKWDSPAKEPGAEHVTIAVSGARGGNTIDFRQLAAQGITLVGRTQSYQGGVIAFNADLPENIARGDSYYRSFLDEADAYVARNGIDLPEDPDARRIEPDPKCLTDPILELNLSDNGVNSIVWATGFAADYSWLKVDACDNRGNPIHQRGVSTEQGIYFLGLPWQMRRGSSFIWGVWQDAKQIADHIVTKRNYFAYRVPSADERR